MKLEAAILLSTAIHAIVIGPLPGIWVRSPANGPDKPVEIEYVKIEDRPEESPKAIVDQRMIRPQEQTLEIKDKVSLKDDKEATAVQAAREAKLRKTRDYINYFQLIREKVRASLRRNYTNRQVQGDVFLVFELDSSGRLLDAKCDLSRSAPNPELVGLAMDSLREASPFQAFPKGLSIPKMTFNLTVTFKKL